MNKKTKRIVIAVSATALGCAGIWGGMILARNMQKKPVRVYAMKDFAMTEYWGDTSETSGMVTTDKLQKVMISDTQTINEIFVQEGQEVQEGDKLLQYDTTLSTLEVKKSEIALQRLKLQLTMAEKELKDLNNMKPHSSVLITPDNDIIYDSVDTPYKLKGTGTKEDPFYFLWSEKDVIGDAFYQELFQESEEPSDAVPQPSDDTELPPEEQPDVESKPEVQQKYVVLLQREQNALNGKIEKSWGLYLKKSGEEILVHLYDPEIPEDILAHDTPKEPYYEESGSEYTASELAKMRDDKSKEITDLKIQIKIAELEHKKMVGEAEDGNVISTVTGTVVAVRDPEEAYKNNEPVVEVSGGGGYYINGAMSELELGTVEVGQKVEINSWMTGTSCEGTIIEILTYPTTNAYSFSNGNQNVSYYPFRVFVDEGANLQENDYVNITYSNQTQSEEGIYLENPFIRTENGQSYVFVKNENGKLEKRVIQTGKDLYGSYTQISGDITIEDYIAFPYGKDVREGAKTKDASAEEFYNH